MINKCYALLLLFLLSSCSASQTYINREDGDPFSLSPPDSNDLVYRVFLIGDAGAPSLDVQEPNLKFLQQQLEKSGERSAAVFLGDNIYMNGLPDSAHPRRAFYEQRLMEQLKTVDNFKGRVVFIPGNHDWDDGGPDGVEAVKRQERFVESYLNRGNTFLPDNGFPGPVSVKLLDDNDDPRLREDIRLIVLDTQWWLHKYDKPYGDTGEYELFDAGDILIELDDILKKQRNDYLLIAAHHPLKTNGNHGGYLPPSTHLKPPVFGSLYALYRRVFGNPQDVHHHQYAKMVDALENLFHTYELEDLIYASGHAHSLQYHREEGTRINHHYLISGSGTKENYVASGRGAEFIHSGNGFLTIQYYGDGSVWLEAWTPQGDGSTGKLLYRNQLKPPFEEAFPDQDSIEDVADIDYTDSTKVAAANHDYDGKNGLFEFFIGAHNRKYWSVEHEFPVFDITEVEDGLTPVRTGGKGQSTTIHLEREDGRDFVLRSVDKEAGRIWDEELKKTIARDLAQDQFSIINPYSALLIPTLADAIGTYHTNPEIYYVPDDPKLGVYADEISGQLALFEERPNGDMSDVASVGFTEEVLSSTELLRELDNDIDHRVDQQAFAKNRLLDMLLADWDRHEDQWRWASFEPEDEKGKIYKPIPRDRDIALMNMTGVIPSLAKVLGPFSQYQNFSDDYGYLKGLNNNSLAMTRRFTNQLTKKDWLDIAEDIKNSLTDEVIEEAVRNYPAPVFEKFGDETIRTFKIRRDKIIDVAADYYELISGVASIQGSNERELFEVQVLSADEIQVKVFKLSGKGEVREQYYERVFSRNETHELRLYGMGDDDIFRLNGEEKNNTKIRIVGGSGNDVYSDSTSRKGLFRQVEIYDTRNGNSVSKGSNTDVNLYDKAENIHYNYSKDFRWNTIRASLFFEYNNDDGLFLGGGPNIIQNGFRKQPASVHYPRANYAPLTGAANVRYNGTWYDVIQKWDVKLEGEFLFPKSYKNFFGFGNETTLQDRSLNYYRARLYQYSIEPGMTIQKNILELYAGINLRGTNVEKDPNNIVTDPTQGIPRGDFDEQWFTGLVTSLHFSDLDNGLNPKQGYRLILDGELNVGVLNTDETFSRLQSELELYFSPRLDPQITIANRVGSAHNIGDFPFYEANTLGGTTNLRGYNGRRFSGRTSFFNNTELRVELFDFYNYLLGGKVGISGFFDVGRVWFEGENSELWHTGYGGGIWFNVFESFLINSSIGVSEEGTLFSVKAGFLF
ncbi:MAG: BamA/TamA family outer membrane protein [Gracilimonas sp.]|uniref:BamA/TamA family outer membrane protein n=1 Tax=Gracilimonas sp. TaxID=1974203 RepID=UPI001AFEB193|nr:BamA/TamA family outer membrane protein [Gracilimonas sp.]MBO6584733.1 BamA/TamA family outer membrane protein [Gracilimonas sp.]MBO6615996.1 BamA/TamA family outer membrane protein [Gracilimonas sp.]